MGSAQSLSDRQVKEMLQSQKEELLREFGQQREQQRKHMQSLIDGLQRTLTASQEAQPEKRFATLLKTLERRFENRRTPVIDFTVRALFMGRVSAGKTTVINALSNANAATGLDATTSQVATVATLPLPVAGRRFELALCDCPGADDTFNYTDAQFITHLALAHVLVVVYTSSIDYLKPVVRIADAMHKPVVFVRSHADNATDEALTQVLARDSVAMQKLVRHATVECLGVSGRFPRQTAALERRWTTFVESLHEQAASAALTAANFDKAPAWVNPAPEPWASDDDDNGHGDDHDGHDDNNGHDSDDGYDDANDDCGGGCHDGGSDANHSTCWESEAEDHTHDTDAEDPVHDAEAEVEDKANAAEADDKGNDAEANDKGNDAEAETEDHAYDAEAEDYANDAEAEDHVNDATAVLDKTEFGEFETKVKTLLNDEENDTDADDEDDPTSNADDVDDNGSSVAGDDWVSL